MEKMLCDLKQDLITKYNYSEDLAETIVLTAESIIDYYGKEYESTLLDAIYSCPFKIKEPSKRNISSFRNRDGYFSSKPVLTKEGNNVLVGSVQKEIVLPNTFNTDNPAYLGVLNNRMIELVNSTLNEYTINGGELIQRQGLMTTTYSINDDLELTKQSEVGRGLSEGINSYQTLSIMRSDYDQSYEPIGSDYTRIIAGSLIDGLGLKDIIISSLVTKNTSELENVIADNIGISLEEFLKKIDKITELETKMSNTLDDSRESIIAEIEENFANEVAPLIRNLNTSLERSEEYVFGKSA